MRVSVTISDEMNDYFVELARECGISKDKAIGSVLLKHMEHNPRGAGRKERTDIDRVCLLDDREFGMSYRAIAKKYNCSVGLVYKLINERK